MTPEQQKALALAQARRRRQAAAPKTTAGGLLGSFAAGVGRGLAGLADLPGAAVNAAAGAATRGMERIGLPEEVGQAARDSIAFGPFGSGDTVMDAARTVSGGGVDFRGDTLPERIAGTTGEFAPAALAGPAGRLRNLATFAGAPAVAAELASDATRNMSFPETMPLVGGQSVEPYARTAAAVAAPGLVRGAERIITPHPADPARIAAADRLRAEGVNTTAGQRTGSKQVQWREAMTDRTLQMADEQVDQFTSAALKRIGIDAPRATPEVMDAAAKKLGSQFDELAQSYSIRRDNNLIKQVSQVGNDFAEMAPRENMPPLLKDVSAKIQRAATSEISGAQYQSWRSSLSRITRQTQDGAVRDAASGLIDALDNAMARSIAAVGRPEDIARWREVRGAWRDFKAIEKAVTAAGEKAALGAVSPLRLRSAIAQQGRSAYARGDRDLGNLARDGTIAMTPLPISGTAERQIAASMLRSGAPSGGLMGGLAYGATGGDPMMTVGAGLLGAAAPYVRNAVGASPMGQAYLGNQLITGGDPVARGLLAPIAALANQDAP